MSERAYGGTGESSLHSTTPARRCLYPGGVSIGRWKTGGCLHLCFNSLIADICVFARVIWLHLLKRRQLSKVQETKVMKEILGCSVEYRPAERLFAPNF